MRRLAGFIGFLIALTGCTASHTGSAPMPSAQESSPPTSIPPVRIAQGRTLHLARLGGLLAAQEAFGSIWAAVSDGGNEKLMRVDPKTGQVQHTFPLTYFPAHEWGGTGLEVGDRAVWAADADAGLDQGIIKRIDPATNSVQAIRVRGRGVEDVAFDSGTVWALVSQKTHGDADVVSIDASSGTVVSSTKFHADWYGGIFPAQGSVWTVERDVKGSTVQGGRLVQVVPGSAPQIALGGSYALPVSDGASLWTPYFGNAQAMNLAHGIARIDPTTGEVLDTWETEAVGYDIAVGEGGEVWFLAGSHLKRLNPSSGQAGVIAAVPGSPIFVLPTQGAIWVGTYKGDLVRFDVHDVVS